jgi:hypothetical protein
LFRFVSFICRLFYLSDFLLFCFDAKQAKIYLYRFQAKRNFHFDFIFRFGTENDGAPKFEWLFLLVSSMQALMVDCQVLLHPPRRFYGQCLGLGISDKKNIPRKTELTEILVYSGGIPTVARNRKLSEFRSEPLRRGEKCLEFSTVEQK